MHDARRSRAIYPGGLPVLMGIIALNCLYVGAARANPPAVGDGSIVLSAEMPHEVELADPNNPAQEDFDTFSWKSFVALNWPANADGTPNARIQIGDDSQAKRVWEFMVHPRDVFLSGDKKPTWTAPRKVGETLQMSKAAPEFRGGALDALHFPVVDQSGNFVMFDVRLNRDEFDYIVANKLYCKRGQEGPNPQQETFVSFPSGVKGGTVGAVEIKTAWRVVLPPDAKAGVLDRYYALPATLSIPAEQSMTQQPFKLNVVLGLVGFHIAHKTKGQPQWVWSTFEHVDNLAAPASGKPTFVDPACTTCPANNRPLPPGPTVPSAPDQPVKPPLAAYLWATKPPFASPNQRIPVQAQRVTPLKASTTRLNEQWQRALRDASAKSVWQYYQLIGTQWPTKPFARQPGQLPGAPGGPTVAQFEGDPAPAVLANIPIETYNQASSSCIRCHGHAFTRNGDYADFSYLLQLAQ